VVGSTSVRRRCGPCILALFALALAGCGSSSRSAASHTVSSPTAGVPAEAHAGKHDVSDTRFLNPGRPLVRMRSYSPESLMWQTVWVTRDGSGVLTTLIGEQVGARQRPFHLSAAQAQLLRRLVGAARGVSPPRHPNPKATLYTLAISGKPSENVQGAMARPLAALVNFLSGLMLDYCC
jgi:hypothetical protein